MEGVIHAWVHVMMVQGHEGGVDDDAEGDKEINKWIKNYKREELCQFDVTGTTIPNTHNIHTLHAEITYPLL